MCLYLSQVCGDINTNLCKSLQRDWEESLFVTLYKSSIVNFLLYPMLRISDNQLSKFN